MAGVKKDELRRVLGQVVSYDGGNKVGTISSVIGDGIRDIPVVDATGGGVTVDSDDSGGCIFAGGGARTIVLPVPAAGLKFKIVSTTAHNHVISSSIGRFTDLVLSALDNTNGTTLARTNIANKCAITLANVQVGEQLECISDGSKWYLKGDLNDTPVAT